jgi:hypothetical protein
MLLERDEVQAAARRFGLEVATSEIRRADDIAPAFDALKGRADGLYVCADPLINTNRTRFNVDPLVSPGTRFEASLVNRDAHDAISRNVRMQPKSE